MENILVAVGPQHPNTWAALHAVALARRMKARVNFLLVLAPGEEGDAGVQAPYRQELEEFIRQLRSEGLMVDYYISQGDYEEELVRFVEEHGVSLLVMDSPGKGRGESVSLVEKIRHRVNCRIEVVHGAGRGGHGAGSRVARAGDQRLRGA